ncbi:MAG: Mediator of RNA polymerase II transcription subunit 7 [Phylliscum demangeonii]|nr:MAG: Mediator of RNA polymerase II transcription subunit 7 [Phylliscum demangeonii]
MADAPAPILSASYPAPPPFWNHFTPANLSRLEDWQAEQDDGLQPEPEAGAKKAPPPELRYLIPPDPPTTGSYRVFGDAYKVVDSLPTLAEQGIEQLYPSGPDDVTSSAADGARSQWTLDRAFYLQTIAKSLLVNFMELVGVLSVDPSQYGRKMEDLRTLFINAHHLLNEYRPHQARETLILMMEEQLKRIRDETDGIRSMKAKVDDELQDLVRSIDQISAADGLAETTGEVEGARDGWMAEQEKIWEALTVRLGVGS